MTFMRFSLYLFSNTGKLRKPYSIRIIGNWMAIVAYFPERNVEANSSIDFGRILPKRLAPLERTIVVNQAEMWDKYRYTHKSQLKQNMFKEKIYIYKYNSHFCWCIYNTYT